MSFYHQSQLVKRARIKRGLTQQDVADKLSLHLQSISNWERGASGIPVARILDLAKLLSVNPQDFYEACVRDYAESWLKNSGAKPKEQLWKLSWTLK